MWYLLRFSQIGYLFDCRAQYISRLLTSMYPTRLQRSSQLLSLTTCDAPTPGAYFNIIPRCTLITRRILCASGLETRCSGTARSSSPQSFKSTRSFTRPSRKFASAETTGFAGLALYLLPAPSHLLHRYRPPQAPSPSFLPVPQSRAYEPPYHARRSLPEARLHAYAARWHHRPMTSRPMMKSRPGPPILLRTHHLARGPPTIC